VEFPAAVRNPTYWVLIISLLGTAAASHCSCAWGGALQDLGHSATVGAWAVSTMTVTGLIGKAILATLGDRIDPRYIFALFMRYSPSAVVIVNAQAMWK